MDRERQARRSLERLGVVIRQELGEGRSLESLFTAGDEFGYLLSFAHAAGFDSGLRSDARPVRRRAMVASGKSSSTTPGVS